jgi:hypothetical protein
LLLSVIKRRHQGISLSGVQWRLVNMLSNPTPTELTTPINPDRGVDGHRNLFCNFYDGCLDEAVKKGWNSWSCTRCGLHAIDLHVQGGIESYATQRRAG